MSEPAVTRSRRSGIPMSLVLRINAVVAFVLGFVLLAATWRGLFEQLSRFRPLPWIYAQIAGATLVALAYMLWRAPRNAAVQETLAQGAAIANILAFVCIAVWLFSNDKGIPSSGSFGSWAFAVTAVVLAVLGVLEGRAFWRRV